MYNWNFLDQLLLFHEYYGGGMSGLNDIPFQFCQL